MESSSKPVKKSNIKEECNPENGSEDHKNGKQSNSKKTTVATEIQQSNKGEKQNNSHSQNYKTEESVKEDGQESDKKKNIAGAKKTEESNTEQKQNSDNPPEIVKNETKMSEDVNNSGSNKNIAVAKKAEQTNMEQKYNKCEKNEEENDKLSAACSSNKEDKVVEEDENKHESKKDIVAAKKMKVAEYLQAALYESACTRGEMKIGNNFFLINGRLLIPKENLLAGRDTGNKSRLPYIWSTKSPHRQLITNKDYLTIESGPLGQAREVETELAAFNVYFTDTMLQNVLNYTNEEISVSEYYVYPKPNFVYAMTLTELQAFIGMLFLFAINKDGKISISTESNSTVINKNRFEYLIKCLRFDDYTTRSIRKTNDSFAEIRDLWEEFIKNCSDVYRPTENCTVDEMFVDFNGNCRFKCALPEDPKLYGIKLVLLCDSNNRYLISGIPYLDKNKNGSAPLAEFMVEKLTSPLCGTNINITYGSSWFPSISLAKKMFNYYGLTTVGILQKSSTDIPPGMIVEKNRPVGTSIFVHNVEDKFQLCSYYSKKKKLSVYLSNIHFDTVIEEPEGKPKVSKFYESTKDGVQAVMKMIYGSSCSRKTAHWFVAIFFAILDFASANSHTIFNLNRSKYGRPPIERIEFLYKLALDLMIPFMKERLIDPNTSDSVKVNIKDILRERQNMNNISSPSKSTVTETSHPMNNRPLTPNPTYKNEIALLKKLQEEFLDPLCSLFQPATNQTKKSNEWDIILSMYPRTVDNASIEEKYKDNFTKIDTQLKYPPISSTIIQCLPLTPYCNAEFTQGNSNIQPNQGNASNIYTCPYTSTYYNPTGNLTSGQVIQNSSCTRPYMQSYIPYNTVPVIPQFMPHQQVPNMHQCVSNHVPNIRQNVPIMNQNILNIQCNLVNMQQYIPNVQQNVPSMLQNVPGMQPNVSFVRQIMPSMQQNISYVQQNVQSMQQSDENIQLNVPNIQNTVSNIVQIAPNIPQIMPNIPHNVMNMPQNVMNIPQHMPNIPENLPNMPQSVPYIQPNILNQVQHNIPGPSTPILPNQPNLPNQIQHKITGPSTPILPNQPNLPNQVRHNLAGPNTPISPVGQTFQPITFVPNTQPYRQTPVPYNVPSPVAASSQSVTQPGKQLCVCGICNYIGNHSFFEECHSCSVLLCMIHRKIVCTECYDTLKKPASRPGMAKRGKCVICIPEGNFKYATQCCKCSEFVCLEHRRIVCLFCI